MKSSRFLVLFPVLALAMLSACSSPDSRIKKNQASFNALPAETQAKIRAGKVEVGYTQAMVLMALGEPDRRYLRTSEKGQTEVWAYRDKGPAFSIGLGIGGGGGRSNVGGGIGVSTAGDREEDKIRVLFEGGKVTATETSTR
ncbi:hypothetical protein CMV30_01540 [Nibricoccus aquaticus]|uniref:Lipoprotein SmpA/OmlA domain-containing protein n=1 Tax=Nibricoccus aquaticus TaxID=2576891 RepID=A0A290Q2L6_9BACT|nr:hypothetical protein [Nibricoccus aquaticus]ATC62754.1 hypothetical protein CMV30_01540 [Nibricoccus aquaticus]